MVDIGSNSVRLVVYDGLRRSPAPIFNEKILCGLGKGVAITGRLNGPAIERALSALRRFRTLVKQIGVKQVYAVATAAAREAENGEDFIEQAERALGAGIRVLTGKEEARFAALGVLSGTPEADGLAGDLGDRTARTTRLAEVFPHMMRATCWWAFCSFRTSSAGPT